MFLLLLLLLKVSALKCATHELWLNFNSFSDYMASNKLSIYTQLTVLATSHCEKTTQIATKTRKTKTKIRLAHAYTHIHICIRSQKPRVCLA